MRFFGQSYLKTTLKHLRTQKLGSLLMKLSQSNFNLRSPDCYLVSSYLIATVHRKELTKYFQSFQSVPDVEKDCTKYLVK